MLSKIHKYLFEEKVWLTEKDLARNFYYSLVSIIVSVIALSTSIIVLLLKQCK